MCTLDKIIMWFTQIFACIGVGFFLFISGYGNYFSINKDNSIKWIIKKISTLFIPIIILIATLFSLTYLLNIEVNFPPNLDKLMSKNFEFKYYVLIFLWYVRFQAFSYVVLWVSKKILKNNFHILLLFLFIIELIFAIATKMSPNFYIYTMCFPSGIFVAKYQKQIFILFHRYYKKLLIFSFVAMPVLFYLVKLKFVYYIFFVPLLSCIMLILYVLRYSIKSNILNYLGKYSYEIYAIPFMIFPILNNLYIKGVNIYIYIIGTLVITIIGSKLLNNLSKYITKMIIK